MRRKGLDAEISVFKGGVTEAIAKGIKGRCLEVDVAMGHWCRTVVADGKLSRIAWHAHGESSCRIIVTDKHIGNGHTALCAWIISGE